MGGIDEVEEVEFLRRYPRVIWVDASHQVRVTYGYERGTYPYRPADSYPGYGSTIEGECTRS